MNMRRNDWRTCYRGLGRQNATSAVTNSRLLYSTWNQLLKACWAIFEKSQSAVGADD
jgi:hypothetical protein